MRVNALREMTARNLPAGKHADGQGLWLVKSAKDRGKWVLRYVLNGARREMGLGRWPDVTIGEARDRAEAARRLARDALDPIAERLRAKRRTAPLTVKEAVEGCFEARKAELKGDGEAGRWMSPLSVHIVPKLGRLPVVDLDQHAIKSALEPIWHTKPEAAAKALNRLNLTLKHAAALGLEVDLQATMKARALLGKQRHTTTHIPSMPYEEAPAFYQWLKTREEVSARALRFLMLTLGRTSEVRLAVKDEVAKDVWVIPAERTKTNREHRVPLVKDARLIAEKAEGPYLFPAYRAQPLSDMAMSKFMRDHKYEARPHGFRATFRTWAEEQTDASFELKEACLGHAVDQGVVPAYQRSDRLAKRRALMEEWAAFLTRA